MKKFIFLLGCMFFSLQVFAATNADGALSLQGDTTLYQDTDFTYTVTVLNNDGPNQMASATVVSSFNGGLITYVGKGGIDGADWTCINTTTNVTCTTTSNIAKDANSTFTYTVKTNSVGVLQNNAVLISTTNDPDGTNNTANVSKAIELSANLSVTKTDSKDPVTISERFTYTISTLNSGPSAATNVKVTDNLPSGLVYYGVSASGWTCSYSGGTLSCTMPTLASGANSSIVIDVAAPSIEGNITNSVSVSSDTHDQNSANNTATQSTQIISNSADLLITMTDSPDPVLTTNELIYTIKVKNLSTINANGIQVTDNLPNSVQFISVSGTDWSCSQGQYIVCDYKSGGVLAGGATTANIIVKVTAPSSSGSITNSVEVDSANPDPIIANNTATASTTVNYGTTVTTDGTHTFNKYLQYNVFGDTKLIGNTNIWKPGTSEPSSTGDNNDYDMTFADIDGDNSTFNSSWANLNLGDPNYEVVWAGLYWLGHICKTSTCDNTNNGGYTTAVNQMGTIKLKGPTGGYVDIVANNLDSQAYNSNQLLYGAFADVTKYVKNQGHYTVANLRTSEGQIGTWGGFGGWALQVIYKDPSHAMIYKNVSVFNGFKMVTTANVPPITVSGFVTPLTGSLDSSLSFFVGDGDAGSISGDILKMYNANTNSLQTVTDSLNNSTSAKPAGGGIFNGSMTELGSYFTDRSNPHVNNLGIDIDRMNVTSFMKNNQNSTNFTFTAGNDIHTINLITFATTMYTPVIDGLEKSAKVGGVSVGAGTILSKRDTLVYSIKFKNTGGETASDVEIFDDFDFDDLTSVFDVSHFDASSIKLSVNKGTAWQSNPNCGYDNNNHIVWCRLAEVKHNDEYIMQFAATISNDYNGTEDKNVTNIAYSKYKNATTNEYIVLTSNGYGGESNTHNAGTILAGGGVIPPTPTQFSAVDIVDGYSGSGVTYDSWIFTKVNAKPNITLNAVYLGSDSANPTPQAYNPSGNQTASIIILYKLADMSNGVTCENAPTVNLVTTLGGSTPVLAILDKGEMTQTSNAFVMGYTNVGTSVPLAKQNVRIKYKAVDLNQLIDTAGVNCANKSSTGGVVEGIPACLITNAPNTSQAGANYKTVFGQTAFDNCYNANGQPCYASNGGVGAAPFDNEYGCFECSIGSMPYTCSRDNFAIRPEKLAINSTAPAMPNLLHSAETYNVAIDAYNNNSTTLSTEYTFTNANTVFDINSTKYDKNNVVSLTMTGNLSFVPSVFNMLNGQSSLSATPGEVAGISFDDVGKVNIHIEDKIWSTVDNDDTPMDCSAAGSYVCGDKNVTFIPDHFDFNVLNIVDNDGNFTYIANDVAQMAGKIDTAIRALNKDGNVTQNFGPYPLYENNVTVVPIVTKPAYTLYPDANETQISNLIVGFGAGVKSIASSETNASLYLRFNFRRDANSIINPFDVNGSDLNISITSHYIDPMDSDTADIIGNRDMNATGKSTFIYGRTYAPRQRFSGNVGTALIYYESFCDGVDASGIICDKVLLPNGITSQSTDDPRWFKNTAHTTANSGVIGTVSQKAALPKVTSSSASGANPDSVVLTYDTTDVNRTYPYKATMENNASSWLIYNKYNINDTTNEFEVEFERPGGSWAGAHETSTTTNSNAASKTNRRIMW